MILKKNFPVSATSLRTVGLPVHHICVTGPRGWRRCLAKLQFCFCFCLFLSLAGYSSLHELVIARDKRHRHDESSILLSFWGPPDGIWFGHRASLERGAS